jgi:catechol 2,3-dioxygenase-like lactoylglutathione lyase family enzyme
MRTTLVIILMLSFTLAVWPITPETQRPRLLGVAGITIRASDLTRSAVFYRDLLGFSELSPVEGQDGTRLFRINERQFVEVLPGLNPAQDRLVSVSLQTDRVEAMRRYLGGRGWSVPLAVSIDQHGWRTIQVADHEGRRLEFIEYPKIAPVGIGKGSNRRQPPISSRLMHAGIIVTDVPPALEFYTGMLGLREFWRGSGRDSKYLSWINMRLPESEDYLELMLYGEEPPGERRGSAHHLCLEVPDIEAARARLEANPARAGYTRPIEIRVGVNRRRQLNLFDPDGTRSELMEPRTIDGLPPVSSHDPYPPR